ncbi:uncharacterized protein LOC114359380 isoform X1 [Ostrinia furnacalis]|uniref:uncharacterized protein LOC114359380 isoform X1 n=1 Tax=Ostrinia furnacalis TaxID=93504 RepID=UPI001038F787|nr:uncharacterized protein LOC114359380 isoform X1 [Ostrinia furnacalis]XP_028169561.1 uncharacterized protein LOC114359380 isoform X2 [Ostrinia furnacalis]XP_028169562.1 uncharacterized protein LOC114359380 isoform X1 [Ostrinia furnacalis]
MKKFEFSDKKKETTKFIGSTFYAVYREAEFLRSSENIEKILARGHELRLSLKTVEPGESVMVDKMYLEKNTPLLVKNTSGANIPVEDYEFTYNRLTGLVAAYAFENHLRFPAIVASEAAALGLVWNNEDLIGCQLYLSAVSGTEHFPQFTFFPLVCALRKLLLKKITLPLVLKIAKIKNTDGVTMAAVLMQNYAAVTNDLWTRFPGSPNTDLRTLLATAPQELMKVFVKPK